MGLVGSCPVYLLVLITLLPHCIMDSIIIMHQLKFTWVTVFIILIVFVVYVAHFRGLIVALLVVSVITKAIKYQH